MRHVFPMTIRVDLGQSVTLFADGTAKGDPHMLSLWMSGLSNEEQPHPGVAAAISLWLLLRAMQDDKRIARAPRA